jgi:hypothetical protein
MEWTKLRRLATCWVALLVLGLTSSPSPAQQGVNISTTGPAEAVNQLGQPQGYFLFSVSVTHPSSVGVTVYLNLMRKPSGRIWQIPLTLAYPPHDPDNPPATVTGTHGTPTAPASTGIMPKLDYIAWFLVRVDDPNANPRVSWKTSTVVMTSIQAGNPPPADRGSITLTTSENPQGTANCSGNVTVTNPNADETVGDVQLSFLPVSADGSSFGGATIVRTATLNAQNAYSGSYANSPKGKYQVLAVVSIRDKVNHANAQLVGSGFKALEITGP